jgi:general secretion pathway protein G
MSLAFRLAAFCAPCAAVARLYRQGDGVVFHQRCAGSGAAQNQGDPKMAKEHTAFKRAAFKRTDRGFTLLELLVVIVIIGLLAGYVAPKYFSQVGKSEVQVARAQIDALEKSLDQYRLDTRRYPSTEEGLGALVTKPSSEQNWNGPYLKKSVPNDPWGHPYVYRTPGQKGEFDLFSYGRDGKPGGTGDDADVGVGS